MVLQRDGSTDGGVAKVATVTPPSLLIPHSPHFLPDFPISRSRRTVDLDFSRTANLLIRERGETAAIEAAQRADAMLDNGDLDGKAVWLRVFKAVRELQEREPVRTVH